ncbi:MAG: carbon monoxide dehydrogenase subunit [Chitinophagaceae bacterium]|nr:carbon monoxide dehydrogenase subunit [Chitinophagaceae bacterium]
MQLTGKHIINAAPAVVWAMLMDTDTLARIVPGISRLEKTGDHTFNSILEIKLGPVNSSFTGNLQLENVIVQKGFTLRGQQNSKIGNASAALKIGLSLVNAVQTEVAFNGDIRLSGLLATMGQRIMSGVANTLSKQFFANLEKEVEKANV